MAEEVASQALVLQTEREKFFSKLQNMRLNNLTAKQQEDLRRCRSDFILNFIRLSYYLFGLSKRQLQEFSESEIKVLCELIGKKAKIYKIGSVAFTFGVPLFGWLWGGLGFLEGDFHSWHYVNDREYLIKIYGKDFFPFDELKLKLQG